MSCAIPHGCIKFGRLDVQCPANLFAKNVEAGSSAASLSGEFWQQYGYNAIWDCYPCHHMNNTLVDDKAFCKKSVKPDGTPVKTPCFSYNYSYEVFLATGVIHEERTRQLPGPKQHKQGTPIDIYYEYLGVTQKQTWYIHKTGKRYVALSYCSYNSGWVNIGGIVWVKVGKGGVKNKLTKRDVSQIDAAYAKVNLSFADFCGDTHGTGMCSKLSGSHPSSGSQQFLV